MIPLLIPAALGLIGGYLSREPKKYRLGGDMPEGGEIKRINELTEIDALKFAKKNWVDFKPSVINDGFCEIWAKHFKEIIGGEIKKTFISDGNVYSHTFIKYKNRYFDAEVPNGISDIMDLPFVKRWIKYADVSPNNKIRKELLESIETKSLNYLNKLIGDKIKSRQSKGSNPDIRYAEGGYIKNIKKLYKEGNGYVYTGNFGESGVLNWRYEPKNNYLYLLGIERNSGKSKGEGSKALKHLFELYPKLEKINFDIENDEDKDVWKFYKKIGATEDGSPINKNTYSAELSKSALNQYLNKGKTK